VRAIFIFTFFLGLLARPAFGQTPAADPHFEIAVDTAGVAEVAPNVYATWVFARESPKHYPVSGILVAFDCSQRKVARMAQVKYRLKADSTGVEGDVEEMPMLQWVDVSIPRLFDAVCAIGPKHGPSVVEPTKPEPDPNIRIS
jgi:hypothetical protein